MAHAEVSYQRTHRVGLAFGRTGKISAEAADGLTLLLREAICRVQGDFIQFSFIASKYHQRLKEEFNRNPRDTQTVKKCIEDLVDYLAKTTIESYENLFGHLGYYFRDEIKWRGFDGEPRVSVKVRPAGNVGQKLITTIARHPRAGYDQPGSFEDVDQNTGLKFISDTGGYYLQQDIPKAASVGDYNNPRLDISSVKLYVEGRPGSTKRFFGKFGFGKRQRLEDEAWARCWTSTPGQSADSPLDALSCYKSTLIVPMTLFRNHLKNDFIERFGIQDVERWIFGYLCFDHPDVHFFNKKRDVNVGYIFADVMSLFLLTSSFYTDASKTFTDAQRFCNQQG